MTSDAFHVDPYWQDRDDTPRTRAKPSRLRQSVTSRRKNQHPFVPSAGTPTLCAHCNAGADEEHRGAIIHV